MAGLAPGNLRLPANEDIQSFDGGDVIVEMSEDAADSPDVNERGDILRIEQRFVQRHIESGGAFAGVEVKPRIHDQQGRKDTKLCKIISFFAP